MKYEVISNEWKDYLSSSIGSRFKEVIEIREDKSQETKKIIEKFVEGSINIKKFYEEIKIALAEHIRLKDGSTSGTVWGANNFKGMMFFNLLMKFSFDSELPILENILKQNLRIPSDINNAKEKIDTFTNWVVNFVNSLTSEKIQKIDSDRILDSVKKNTNPSYSIFFLSLFWFIQDTKRFPCYWTASEKVFKKTEYYKSSNSNGENYEQFYNLNNDIIGLIRKKNSQTEITLQDISGLFYFLHNSEEEKPKTIAKPSLKLSEYIDQFLKEIDFPDNLAKTDYDYIKRYQKIFSKDEIDFIELKEFKNFYLSREYGYVGFMTTLNRTINEAPPKEIEKIRNTIKYILYGEDEVNVRINGLLDENSEYKITGLGGSIIMKLLATVYPEKYITVFNYSGDMGKRNMMKMLEIPLPVNESDLSLGDLAIISNDALINFFKKYNFKDNLHIRRFLYWYKDKLEEVDIKPADLLKKEMIENTNMDEEFLDEIIEQLKMKGQIILYGPPGTGKTFIAKEIAKYLTKDRVENSKIVQFHPSYGYEDLIQSIFPKKEGGNLVYEYKDGTFKEFCGNAIDDNITYVFIIDEINRGNIPKIFGELIYLLEYRNEEINLQYSGDTFSIPKNILIIGTMNTADKSIALLDIALRRRFKFFEIEPSEKILAKFYKKNIKSGNTKFDGLELDQLIKIFKELNEKIIEDIDKHHQIGHSYYMKNNGSVNKEYLNKIWLYEIKPLLEEYFFDDYRKVEEYWKIFQIQQM